MRTSINKVTIKCSLFETVPVIPEKPTDRDKYKKPKSGKQQKYLSTLTLYFIINASFQKLAGLIFPPSAANPD